MYVVVTGASRGIGLELTEQALDRGDHVLAVARKPKDSDGLMALQKKHPKTMSLIGVDLAQAEAAEKVAAAVNNWPQVDVLINNAGIYRKGEKIEDFLTSFHVNAIVPFLVTRALLPRLRKGAAPRVVQITSLMGSVADNSSGGSHAYRSSKSALNMLNKGLAVENEWLTAVVMHPGWVKTDMGGSGAPVEIADSATGIWRVTRELKSTDSGKFFDFRGKNLPW
jgi:NAD(P)-dependent dehydrogenase (short-subunit alcohol dehydrogenase family)